MRKRNFAACAGIALAVMLAVGLAGPPLAAAAEPARPAGIDAEVLAEYQKRYPDVAPEVLVERLRLTPARKELLERLAVQRSATFGGSWYDYGTGVWHLSATESGAAQAMAAEARTLGIAVRTKLVRYSYEQLWQIAERIDAGGDPALGDAARGRVGVDPDLNQVTVALRPADRGRLDRARAAAHPAVTVRIDDSPEPTPAACVDRRNCGQPLRAGITLWRENYNIPYCSNGFAAHGADGSRWALTAGHCELDISSACYVGNQLPYRLWGHGGQWLGPVRSACDEGQVDVARIRIDNPYWRNSSFGWLYGTPSVYFEVDRAIASRASIEVGDVVCYSGTYAERFGDHCGFVIVASSSRYRGMPQVADIYVCHGDSGGAVYFPQDGGRTAFGLVSAATFEPGQNCNTTERTMFFSPLPNINAHFDATSAATIRVTTR